MSCRVHFYKVLSMGIQTGSVYSKSIFCGKIYIPIHSTDIQHIFAINIIVICDIGIFHHTYTFSTYIGYPENSIFGPASLLNLPLYIYIRGSGAPNEVIFDICLRYLLPNFVQDRLPFKCAKMYIGASSIDIVILKKIVCL